jgi:branched-chain amino acid aminotransferase
MNFESRFVWMDGRLVPYEQATVHFSIPALHYGYGVFEGIRCYATQRGPAIFRLRDHIQRLLDSARTMLFDPLEFSLEELCQACKETVKANGFQECYLRPLAFSTGPNLSLNQNHAPLSVGISSWEWAGVAPEDGFRANISNYTRHHPNAMLTKAKTSGNYPNSILAKIESVRAGFDECILLDPQGYVAEGAGSNLFVVRKGRIYTSPVADVLDGITRDTIAVLAQDLGYSVQERILSRDMLYTADEVFVCGTAAEVVGIREIDYRAIGAGKQGPITLQLQAGYQELVHGRSKRSAEWCENIG